MRFKKLEAISQARNWDLGGVGVESHLGVLKVEEIT